MTDWREIATAPDDEYVLLYTPDATEKAPYVVAFRAADGEWYEWDAASAPVSDVPTHWMPLPSPNPA